MKLSGSAEAELVEVFKGPVTNALRMRTVTEPWDEAAERLKRPFHYALVPPEVWKGAKFERSFVTSLGSVWEAAAVIVGRTNHGWAERGYTYTGTIHRDQLLFIDELLTELEHPKKYGRSPAWDTEIEELLRRAKGPKEERVVNVDVAVGNTSKAHSTHKYFEIKAPFPNSDQTKVSKEKMLKLCAMEARGCAYFGLPFNPYGERAKYAHWPPKRWFNMHKDSGVLIGAELWDEIGGEGAWEELLRVADSVGEILRMKILSDYLLDS